VDSLDELEGDAALVHAVEQGTSPLRT